MIGDVVYLGERGYAPVPDFDGRVRVCQVLSVTTIVWGAVLPCVAVQVEPPISLGGHILSLAVLVPSDERKFGDLAKGLALEVDVCQLHTTESLDSVPLALSAVSPFTSGIVATSPGALPLPPNEEFVRMVASLRRYVADHAHTDVPSDWLEDGLPLGAWVERVRLIRRVELDSHKVGLDPSWVGALEATPKWHW